MTMVTMLTMTVEKTAITTAKTSNGDDTDDDYCDDD